jgi:hypothetical protein
MFTIYPRIEALRSGYPELYARSEYAHTLSSEKLRNTVIELTGFEKDDQKVRAIVGTFQALKAAGGVDGTTTTGMASSEESSPSVVALNEKR